MKRLKQIQNRTNKSFNKYNKPKKNKENKSKRKSSEVYSSSINKDKIEKDLKIIDKEDHLQPKDKNINNNIISIDEKKGLISKINEIIDTGFLNLSLEEENIDNLEIQINKEENNSKYINSITHNINLEEKKNKKENFHIKKVNINSEEKKIDKDTKLIDKKINNIYIKDSKVNTKLNLVEVKDIIFPLSHLIIGSILYNNMPFVKDPKNLKSYPNKINYRCKLYRKNNHKLDGFFCHSIVKRIVNKENITYEMIRDHNEECKKFNIIHKNYEDNTIHNYEEFVKQCRTFMDSSEFYNKKEFRVKLLDIYNKEKYNFKLKDNTIDNIINNWKSNSIKFSKYNALENYKNEENEIILWEHRTSIIYLPNKKKAIYSEYFIWSHDQMTSRSRIAHHFFIDCTFHHPKNFQQLLITFVEIFKSKTSQFQMS